VCNQAQFFGVNATVDVAFVSSTNASASVGVQSVLVSFEYAPSSGLFTVAAQASYEQACVVGETVCCSLSLFFI
jgi:hypothetical protein